MQPLCLISQQRAKQARVTGYSLFTVTEANGVQHPTVCYGYHRSLMCSVSLVDYLFIFEKVPDTQPGG